MLTFISVSQLHHRLLKLKSTSSSFFQIEHMIVCHCFIGPQSHSVMGPEAQFSALVYFICVFCCSLLCLATITHIILLAWEALPFPCQPCSHTHARAHSHTHSNTTHLWDYRVIIKANIYLWAYSLTLTYNMQVDWFIALSHNSSCEIKLWWRTTDLL